MDIDKIPSPCYVVEESLLEKNLQTLDDIQNQANVEIILALKGFAMWSCFPMVKKYLKGIAASSLNEAKLSFYEMKAKAHTYCVAYEDESFDELMNISAAVTFNSLSQFEKYKNRVPKDVTIGIRVNPEFSEVKTAIYNPSSPISRLGITAQHNTQPLPPEIQGLHFHALCESNAEDLAKVLHNLEQKFGNWLAQVKWLNIGGGHLATRLGYNKNLLIKLLKDFQTKHKLNIILEPSSAIAWQTGFLKSTVLDIVENNGVKTAIANISFTCHMPDCLEMPYRPHIRNAHIDPKQGKYQYKIGGLSCLAGDFIDEYGFDKPLQIGDTLIFEDMIHYTTVKTTHFNGIAHPTLGIYKKDNTFQLIKKFGYEDYKNKLS